MIQPMNERKAWLYLVVGEPLARPVPPGCWRNSPGQHSVPVPRHGGAPGLELAGDGADTAGGAEL